MGMIRDMSDPFFGYKPPTNGDKELRRIMKDYVRRAAAKTDLTPEEYEKRIRRNGTYSAVRKMCHKLLFLAEKICDELLAQKQTQPSTTDVPRAAA